MRNATRILLTAAGLLAAGNSARAQAQGVIQAPAGQAFTIISNVPASAVTEVTYQWYRDNSPILDATQASYTVPAAAAYGDNVQFYRMATAQECAGVAEKKSNIVTITFTGYIIPSGCNLIVAGVCWADCHIDNPQTFAAQADMCTNYYQWNSLAAYSADDPLTTEWNSTRDESAMWTVNPCPDGWRLPTQEEYQQLHNLGSTWENANARSNAIAGRFYGYNHATCRLPSTMKGCVFFPASGRRDVTGIITGRNSDGYGMSSTQMNNGNVYLLSINSGNSNPTTSFSKLNAFPIRCVK